MIYNNLKNKVAAILEQDSDISIMDAVFMVVNFDTAIPDVQGLLAEDETLGNVLEDDGHNSINYPDEPSLSDIVITNVQERIASELE